MKKLFWILTFLATGAVAAHSAWAGSRYSSMKKFKS